MKKIAVILAGCGFLDGAEIRESVLALLSLDKLGADYQIFSINQAQHHVIDHATSTEADQTRNVLEESARIARGAVSELSTLEVSQFDALVMPGGFGVAKNLSSFAFEGSAGTVVPAVARVIREFNDAGKPIGAICISPAIVAMVLGGKAPTLTLGEAGEAAQEMEKTGAKHQVCSSDDFVLDAANKILSTPAYMNDSAKLSAIDSGIFKMTQKLIELC